MLLLRRRVCIRTTKSSAYVDVDGTSTSRRVASYCFNTSALAWLTTAKFVRQSGTENFPSPETTRLSRLRKPGKIRHEKKHCQTATDNRRFLSCKESRERDSYARCIAYVLRDDIYFRHLLLRLRFPAHLILLLIAPVARRQVRGAINLRGIE